MSRIFPAGMDRGHYVRESRERIFQDQYQTSSGGSSMNSEAKTVLVVEDKASLTQMLQFLFLSKGLSVQIAYNGREALEKAGSILPSLILMDIMMPEMNGFEVLERLKQDPATTKIPVIMLTARKSREDMQRAKDLGAVEYITKPFKAVEVVDKVLRHLR